MVGTATITRLLDQTTSVGAKLVLVGDHRQLPEIEAGGAFAALAHTLSSATLTTNRRQDDPEDRRILAEGSVMATRPLPGKVSSVGIAVRSFDHDDRSETADGRGLVRRHSPRCGCSDARPLPLRRRRPQPPRTTTHEGAPPTRPRGLSWTTCRSQSAIVSSPCATATTSVCSTATREPSARSTPKPAHSAVQSDRGTHPRVPTDYLADGHLTHG